MRWAALHHSVCWVLRLVEVYEACQVHPNNVLPQLMCWQIKPLAPPSGQISSGYLVGGTEKAMAPHSSPLAWKTQGRRSLEGCGPWGREESDTTERLHFHFSLSCTGEGNGNPLQCSCLENPRGGGAWWAAVYGVAQCRTRLKRLSSSSSSSRHTSVIAAGSDSVSSGICSQFNSQWIPRTN